MEDLCIGVHGSSKNLFRLLTSTFDVSSSRNISPSLTTSFWSQSNKQSEKKREQTSFYKKVYFYSCGSFLNGSRILNKTNHFI